MKEHRTEWINMQIICNRREPAEINFWTRIHAIDTAHAHTYLTVRSSKFIFKLDNSFFKSRTMGPEESSFLIRQLWLWIVYSKSQHSAQVWTETQCNFLLLWCQKLLQCSQSSLIYSGRGPVLGGPACDKSARAYGLVVTQRMNFSTVEISIVPSVFLYRW